MGEVKRETSSAQSKKESENSTLSTQVPVFIKEVCIVCYMIISSFLTLVNKYLYAKYHFKSPLNLLFMQCLCNMIICLSLMSWKQFVNKNSFEWLKEFGII